MAYSWDNRVNFVVRYLYDIDHNGYLDQNDFLCMALRATVIEGRGDFNSSRLSEYQHIMLSLWDEIAELADFNKVSAGLPPCYASKCDGKITVEEFKEAVQKSCVGRRYQEFPQAMKAFIEANFKMVDLNSDGVIGPEEFRYDCVQRIAVDDIEHLNEAYNSLLNDDDRRRGGLTLSRYQELYAQFLGDPNEKNPAVYLFGPIGLNNH